MGHEMSRSDTVLNEGEPMAATAYDDEYDFAMIGMESACPALQAQHWHQPAPQLLHQSVNDQGAQ